MTLKHELNENTIKLISNEDYNTIVDFDDHITLRKDNNSVQLREEYIIYHTENGHKTISKNELFMLLKIFHDLGWFHEFWTQDEVDLIDSDSREYYDYLIDGLEEEISDSDIEFYEFKKFAYTTIGIITAMAVILLVAFLLAL